ncbi:MAG: hypothetical protein HYS25_17270 [Ignavibacteriales bacterium]|nr:hypothetical protein [Ignavibacteriales bacterium]
METIIAHNYTTNKAERVTSITSLSEDVIPATPGKYYSYTADFSKDRPLYFMMDCKANKGRSLNTDVKYITQELDLTFVFGNEIILCSPDSNPSKELLKNIIVEPQELNHSELRIANITEDTFYDCFQEKRDSLLVDIYNNSNESESSLVLYAGLILSVKTYSGKYGLIIVKELIDTTCKIDACHILLK